MKILLTVHQFLPDYSTGTEILTYETARELQQRGHTVRVFTAIPAQEPLSDDQRFDHYTYNGLEVERYRFSLKPVGSQSNPVETEYDNHLVREYFRQYLECEKPDLVHFFHLAHLSASPIDACYDLGIPMVLTPTDFWFMCPAIDLRFPGNQICEGPDANSLNCLRHMVGKTQSHRVNSVFGRIPNRLLRPLIRFVKNRGAIDPKYTPMVRALALRQAFLQERINKIDKVAIPTRLMHTKLTGNGLDPARTEFLPFGLNLSYIQNASRPEPREYLNLGYIGTLNEHKGAHILLKAMRQLPDKPVRLKIYGKMSNPHGYVGNLLRLAGNDPRIEFCGTFPNPEIGAILSELDALVVPSLWHENSPLVIYSAQYARCPVIASNMAGMSEVIAHEENGLLFEAGNVAQLAETIQRALDDRTLLPRLSANARMPLSIQRYVDRLLEIYSGLPGKGN